MVTIKDLTFLYNVDDGHKRGVNDITMEVAEGEFVVLCGRSGCGKSTLLRTINGLIPHFYEGSYSGMVCVNGKDIKDQELSSLSQDIGSVFQNPATQFFNVDTTSELAFGCENLGLPICDIERRVRTIVEDFELEDLLGRSIFELSGGQKQQIACGSVLATLPKVLVFDEPSASMDDLAIERFTRLLLKLKAMGKTVIVSEHQLYYLKGIADRFIYMENGEISEVFSHHDFHTMSNKDRKKLGLRDVNNESIKDYPPKALVRKNVIIENMIFYREDKKILNIPKLSFAKGEVTAIIGENGAGKSTFAKCLTGMEKSKGSISINDHVIKHKKLPDHSFMVMQDVNAQLFAESVLEEVTLLQKKVDQSMVESVLDKLDLWEKRECHPMSLSGGEKQRLAVASAIIAKKEIIVFDEPTSGLDYQSMLQMGELIDIAKKDSTCIVITHDKELINHCCNRVVHLFEGKIKGNSDGS